MKGRICYLRALAVRTMLYISMGSKKLLQTNDDTVRPSRDNPDLPPAVVYNGGVCTQD